MLDQREAVLKGQQIPRNHGDTRRLCRGLRRKAVHVNVGNAEILLNHPCVFVGVPADLAGDATGADSGGLLPVKAVMVNARAQRGPVRIRLWLDVGPAAGSCVFDGVMVFPAGVVRVSDLESLSVFSHSTGRTCDSGHGVCIYVDDVDAASRVDILIDADGPVSQLTAVPGYELAPVRGVSPGGLRTADELGLILDGYDRPFSRLAAAVRLLLGAADTVPPDRAAAVNHFRTSMIGEWMRGLGGPERAEDALRLASVVEDRLAGDVAGDVDGLALDVAADLLRAAGLQVLGHDQACK
jgi:hypothetical protein